jgi:pyrroline-5-carboxylate reductase
LPFRDGQSVVSVMVNVPLACLRALCAPATDIAITIALPPVAQGGCPLPVHPPSPALATLYGARNPVFVVRDEAALNAHFGATALCSPLLAQMLTASEWLSQHTGDAAQAEAYVSAAIRSLLPPPGSLGSTLQALSTEDGLNAGSREAMQPATQELRRGLEGFEARLGLGGEA